MSPKEALTVGQVRQITSDLNEVKLRAERIADVVRVGFGPKDHRTIRAEELVAAIQRMQWAIEREGRIGAD